jgi:hypothetical protein
VAGALVDGAGVSASLAVACACTAAGLLVALAGRDRLGAAPYRGRHKVGHAAARQLRGNGACFDITRYQFGYQSRGAAMSELSRLMLKAVRSLPAEEQDKLMEAILEARLAPCPAPAVPTCPPPTCWPARARRTGSTAGIPASRSPSAARTRDRRALAERPGPPLHRPARPPQAVVQANGFTMAVVLRGPGRPLPRRPGPAPHATSASAPGGQASAEGAAQGRP